MSRLALAAAAALSVLRVAAVRPLSAQEHDPPAAEASRLGRLSFPTSCAPGAQGDFERALAMLHSFWYQASERAFRSVADRDPNCAIAYWGIAMSRFRQLWEHPGPEDLRVAEAALDRARGSASASGRERAYIGALDLFYRGAPGVPHLERVRAYEGAMRTLRERHPDDPEAAVFHALALLSVAAASAPDPEYARQREALAVLGEILASQPDHPGVAHYIIHASDYPALAGRGLEAARRYAEIAPGAPHALHMPSHIFTRLGLWEESVASNRAAAASARADGWIGEELHATDYLAYAHLQRARDGEAARLVEALPARTEELREADANYWAGVYAAAAIPARYALERRRWREAAGLEVPREVLPGGVSCWAGAALHLARGLGASHTGDLDAARRSIAELAACRELLLASADRARTGAEPGEPRVTVPVPVWASRLEVQRRAVAARVALAEGRQDEAVARMRSAADLEDAGDKPPITPGSVAPARELLGELLLELDRPVDALAEFRRALESSPDRFRALYGAARSARLAGDHETARGYYRRLLEIAADGARRPELDEAMRFVGDRAGRGLDRRADRLHEQRPRGS